MQNDNFDIMSTPLLDDDLPIFSSNVEVTLGSYSSMTSCYTFDSLLEPMNLFPDLPQSATEEGSGRFDIINNDTREDFTMLWDMNDIDMNLMPMMNGMSLDINNRQNTLFSYDERGYFSAKYSKVDHEYQQQQQQQVQQVQQVESNIIDWNPQINQTSFNSENPNKLIFSSPLSVDTVYTTETPVSNQIILPETSKSASLIDNKSTSSSSTCSRYRKHQQKKPGGVSCHICEKPFGRRQEAKRHLLIHTGLKSFKCDICFYSFLRKDALDRHQKTLAGRCGDRRLSYRRSSVE